MIGAVIHGKNAEMTPAALTITMNRRCPCNDFGLAGANAVSAGAAPVVSIEPQKRHLIASSWIDSAQNGQAFIPPSKRPVHPRSSRRVCTCYPCTTEKPLTLADVHNGDAMDLRVTGSGDGRI